MHGESAMEIQLIFPPYEVMSIFLLIEKNALSIIATVSFINHHRAIVFLANSLGLD